MSKPKGIYKSLPTEDPDEKNGLEAITSKHRHALQNRAFIILIKSIALTLPLIFLIVFLSKVVNGRTKRSCQDPPKRREWRSASPFQRRDYIDAVQCLMQLPSTIDERTTKYDDFVYVHSQMSAHTHYSGAFLAWHRLYIHAFEMALREECGYGGHLMYWNWAFDSNDLASSPVWDPNLGFGSNGNEFGCIEDGPFANTTRYWNAHGNGEAQVVNFEPHCITRNFSTEHRKSELQDYVTYMQIEKTLQQPTYEEFFKVFETGAHNAIPQFVRGDFLTFTAPNDPVFFLHHTQVDHLWWLWQQRDLKARLHDFSGPRSDFRKSGLGHSTLDDVLPMMGLTQNRMVREVMSSETNLLCYKYS